jgi:hypothetical protein
MQDLIERYRKLKIAQNIRDEIKAASKAEYERRLAGELEPYETLDDEIYEIRNQIQNAMGDSTKQECDGAVVSVITKRNVVVDMPSSLELHLREKGLTDLLKVDFHKAKLNKIVLAYADTGIQQLPGVKIEEEKQLRVELSE